MRRLRLQVRRIGPHFRSVLMRGESGTGKELVARALHGMSPGSGGQFVVCQATALEDALADCSPSARSTGVFGTLVKASQRGTLFLDNVSAMPLEAQDRLLRALRDHEVAQGQVLRTIASTTEDLKTLASTGRFRQELHQRLATVDITVPPLRERMEDLPELARRFLGQVAPLSGRSVRRIADEAAERMQRYHWPGNVRELESVLRNGVLLSEGDVLESRHLPPFTEANESDRSKPDVSESVRLEDVVGRHVVRVLNDCAGNKLRAAEVLGISRSTLYRMLDSGAQHAVPSKE